MATKDSFRQSGGFEANITQGQSIQYSCSVVILCFVFSLPTVLQSISLGRPGPLCSAADLHEQVRQLVWRHASGALPNETGPGAVQGPGLHPPQEIQGDREALTRLAPPVGRPADHRGHRKTTLRGGPRRIR